MFKDEINTFADQVGRFYVKELGFPPVAGRMLAYLAVCEPAGQSINALAEALLASRSAVTQATTMLEGRGLVHRWRNRGERVDRIAATLDVATFENDLDVTGYGDHAVLLRRGVDLLPEGDSRRLTLAEVADFYEFVASRLPQLKAEWREHRSSSGDPK